MEQAWRNAVGLFNQDARDDEGEARDRTLEEKYFHDRLLGNFFRSSSFTSTPVSSSPPPPHRGQFETGRVIKNEANKLI